MRKFLLLIFLSGFFCIKTNLVNGQNCVPTGINGSTVNLYCGQTCTDLIFQVPNLKSTEDYAVSSIPYQPFAFSNPFSPALLHPCTDGPTTAQDDKFLDTTFLPFAFCFYGATYSKLCIGTNGLITFDTVNALKGNNYTIGATGQLPFQGTGTQGTCPGAPPGALYPRACIMGAYHDIWPRTDDPNYKIEARTEGSAPCRRFIISFNNIQQYSCTTQRTTFQIVLYESTGIIDIYIQSKPSCTTSNGNRAIVGIQDWTFTKWAAPPNRNCASFTASNEAWRFTPNGPTSRFVSSELLTLSGAHIADATTTNGPAGLLNLKFLNFCPGGPGQFLVKTTFSDCSNAGNLLTSTDTFNIAQVTSLPLTGTATPTNCGGSSGTITANVTGFVGTPPYQYSIDGGALQPGNFFTGLIAGNHSLHVIDFNGCQNTITVFVPTDNTLNGNAVPTATSCPGVNNGTITVTPLGGVAPFTYSLNGGPLQPSNIFTGLAPNIYSVTFYDAGGCSGSALAQVLAGAGLTANSLFTNTGCSTVNDGTATVTPTSGTAPYTYSLNGGPSQSTGLFTGLAPNTYNITVTDVNGCNGTFSGTVSAGAALASTYTSTNPPCSGINNGTITVTPGTGTAPYLFSLNGGPTQASGTFAGLGANTYLISFSDANGCTGSTSVTLTPATPLTTTSSIQDANCFGDNNGSITLIPSGGTTPYQFSINGGTTYQPVATFNGLIAGSYSIRIRDVNGCNIDNPFTIAQPTLLTASATPTAATCNGNDGVITINAGGGSPAYQFSIDNGITYQSPNTFTVIPASYNNIIVKDTHGCLANSSATVILTDTMRLGFGPDLTTCQGTPATLTPLTNSATSIFTWTPATGLSSTTIQNPSANPTDTTIYTLVAKWGSCQRTASTRVNILYKPVANAGNDTAICFKTFALLRGSSTHASGAVSYLWTPSLKATPATAAFSVARPDSTQLFTLEVSDNYGCNFKVYDDVLITMQPPVPAYAGNDTNAVYGIPHQLFSSGGVSYLWSPAGPLDNPFIQYPKATLTGDTRFTVQVTDVAGCIGTDDVLIKVYKGPTYYVVNAFTPNGDGLNDIFRPIPVGIVSTEFFRVFNRYGQMVFETTKWLDGWNGFFQNKKQPQGTYTWMIKGTDRNGKVVEMKGTVLLLQ
ncbi:MAG: gliding motility-associated C-terminal domain-containing protein [Ferruginibacter sp.]